MIEIRIPEEVTKYEAKLVGPFTTRQCVVLVIFVPICFGVYQLGFRLTGSGDIASYFLIPFAGLGALFGWVKPYGHPFEKFVQAVFINMFIAPSKRKAKSDNIYDRLCVQTKKMSKKDWMLLDAEMMQVPDDEVKSLLKEMEKQEKKQKKEKYIKSKKAIF